MKLTITTPQDNKVHTYCMRCQQESVSMFRASGKALYRCTACKHENPRALIIDPAVTWWTDKSGEYWHKVSGVFVRNGLGQFLFFERTKYPLGLTIPAGHGDVQESELITAKRELYEETGLSVPRRALRRIGTDSVVGDQCRRGSDAHEWHSFMCQLPVGSKPKIDSSEGVRPVWLTLEQAYRKNLTYVTRYVIRKHGRKIQSSS